MRKPVDDFDLGGTRARRNNHVSWQQPRIIDVAPTPRWQRFAVRLGRVSTHKLMLLVLFLGFVRPMVLIIGGQRSNRPPGRITPFCW